MRDDSANVLLGDYLAATEESDVELLLTRILDELAKPIIRRIVASMCRDWARIDDAEDIVSDTLTDLLRLLRDLRSGSMHRIHDLRAYIVTCAYNRCHERLRARYPARNRLRNHLHYLFHHHADLALWRTSNGTMVCGFRDSAGQAPIADERSRGLSLAARSDASAENRAQINSLVFAALQQLGAPLELDALIDVIARLIHLEQHRIELALSERLVASAPAADASFDLRMSLRQLWEDIHQLSLRQRTALILNLRDSHGREIVSLLPHTGTASIAEIADAVQIPLDTFNELWKELPLSDAAIADLLNASPRQVIKLRRLARERLRRMARSRDKLETVHHRQNHGVNSDSSMIGLGLQTRIGGRTTR